ncbi:MAG TPA: helix-turn-helix transcriptional regulator [Flavipsychrobacter sp.]|nr:helix-turn-helix transcriptional regulator [Flavipsychrobacter sp.]
MNKAQEKRLKKLDERIKEIRTEKGMTLKDLAHTIGKDPQSISRVELGKSNPTFIYLTEICEGLGIEVSELVQGL